MATTDTTSTDLNYADTLWKSADALRGQVDAAEYKHVVLGLLFLKYISDSFESRRDALGRVGQYFLGNSPRPRPNSAVSSSRRVASCACWSRCSNPTRAEQLKGVGDAG